MGDRVPLVSKREWAEGRRGVRATAACRHRKLKEPSTGATGPACPAPPLIPLLGLPAAVAENEML